MLAGYNTNGFAHHRLDDALEILADLGYRSVALTLDHHVLNPLLPDLDRRLDPVRYLLESCGLACVIESGARFLLDPRHKHQPTLLSPTPEERQVRLEFLQRCVDVAAELGAGTVSFWSGAPTNAAPEEILWDRLVEGCRRLEEYAAQHQVRLAFEPEPGMFVDTMARFARLKEAIPSPWFGLTLDIGHLHCLGETPIAGHILQWKDWLWNVHLEDMKAGVHDHLMFGEGDIDFPPVFAALRSAGYAGGLHVELSRHGHDAVNVARRCRAFLTEHGVP